MRKKVEKIGGALIAALILVGVAACENPVSGSGKKESEKKPSGAQYVMVSAGAYYSMGIKKDGTLWAWGKNDYSQLGDGTTSKRNTPVQVGSDTWLSVSAGGGAHTVGIKADGTLWAWGYNFSGQLGDGTKVDKASPVQIGTDVWKAVSAGGAHTVGIKADGTLWAWGYNWFGQLGDGSEEDRNSPVKISSDKWKTVSAGAGHTVGIKADGTLWAWGQNVYGQLGNGSHDFDVHITPVQIGTGTWIAVSAGSYYTIGIKAGGTLWAWGDNLTGQLGDGTKVDKASPVQIGTGTWKAVFAGGSVNSNGSHAAGIKTDGTLWAWGRNYSGQLGDGTKVDTASPVQIGTDTWKTVSAGLYYTMGIKANDTLWAWGNNSFGQLGTGAHDIFSRQESSPVQVEP